MTTTILPIHPLSTHGEIRAVEQLQREVWDLPDVEVMPLHVLLTAAKNGGLLLGAFDDERLVGFVFGFPGLTPEGRLKHCSHMAGVHPDYRDRGLGYSLKLAQRLHVLAQGIDLITWTFDPLETRNAALNFHKLGVVCNTYFPNLYGDMRDGLNAGLPSDRFQVDWWIASERVAQRLAGEPPSNSPLGGGRAGAEMLVLATIASPLPSDPPPSEGGVGGGFPCQPTPILATIASPLPSDPPPSEEGVRGGRAGAETLVLANIASPLPSDPPPSEGGVGGGLIAIPTDFQSIKAADIEQARALRLRSRSLFEWAFASGYRVTDFFVDGEQGYYLIES